MAEDVYRPVSERASDRPPTCYGSPEAGAHDPVAMTWMPAVGRMDASGGSGFTPFSVDVLAHGQHTPVVIDSLHKLRQVERDSEQAHRNGEGQPMRFRMWSNDRTNGDVNTFGKDPGTLAREELSAARQELRSRVRFGMAQGKAVTSQHGEASE